MKILLICFILASCNSEEKLFSREEIYSIGKQVDPSLKLVIPKSLDHKLVDCDEYIPKCEMGYKVEVKLVRFNAIMYKNHKDAKAAAKYVKGMYARNWVFDYVKGEPILERFVKKAFDAKSIDE
ncbi:MAG: hypothetical protein N4A33_04195 [Bacteriovoracaceae bacterium]|jgi:hypothetical protein|nr:hypothetical protein [Bacteriovoracaceae bacterium]